MGVGSLHQPTTLEEALAVLSASGGDCKVLAGGQSLVLMLHDGLLAPGHLVSLQRIENLRGILVEDGGLRIGAMTTQREVETSELVAERCPVLQEAASRIASVHIRHLGTVGGNLCHSLVGADLPPVLIALDAQLEIAAPGGSRLTPADGFFQGFMETAIEEDEILTAVHIPAAAPGAHSAYLKHCVRVVDPSIVGVAATLEPDPGTGACHALRIGIGGAAEIPQRARAAEAQVRGAALNDETFRRAGEAAANEVECLTDVHASADYRRRMIGVFVRRALLAASHLEPAPRLA